MADPHSLAVGRNPIVHQLLYPSQVRRTNHCSTEPDRGPRPCAGQAQFGKAVASNQKKGVLKEKMDAVGKATEAVWANVQGGTKHALDDMKAAVERAANRSKSPSS